MSYIVYGAQGEVGPFCTFVGLQEMANYIAQHPGIPVLKEFMDHGYTTAPKTSVSELQFLLEDPKDMSPDVKSTLEKLMELISTCEEVAIIAQ